MDEFRLHFKVERSIRLIMSIWMTIDENINYNKIHNMIHLTWIENLQELNSFDEELVGEGPAANIVIQSIISHEPPSAKLLPHCSLPFI